MCAKLPALTVRHYSRLFHCTKRSFVWPVVLIGALMVSACDNRQSPQSGLPTSEAPAPPSYLAANIYRNRCATCHGATGAGDGPAAAGLNPRPRNFADPAWHARATDAYLRRVILEGGAAVGKSPLMPPAPDLAAEPAVLTALIERVKTLMHRP